MKLPANQLTRAITRFSTVIRRIPKTFTVKPQDYIVGGFVRDTILGLNPLDADVEVYGVNVHTLDAAIRQHFADSKIISHATFGVWEVRHKAFKLSYSVPRTETKTGAGHRGFTITLDPSLPPQKAILRRDFTINTLLLSPQTGRVFDYAGGKNDLKHKLLKALSPARLPEDPLRAWRAVQIVGRFNLQVEPNTDRLIQHMSASSEMRLLSGQRIREELDKLLAQSANPSKGLLFAKKTTLLRTIPEIYKLSTRNAVWRALLKNLDNISSPNPEEQLQLRWACILKALAPAEKQALYIYLQLPNRLRAKT